MIEPASAAMPVSTWAKHNNTEVVRYDRKHGEEHRLQTVFRTVYYEFADGQVSKVKKIIILKLVVLLQI